MNEGWSGSGPGLQPFVLGASAFVVEGNPYRRMPQFWYRAMEDPSILLHQALISEAGTSSTTRISRPHPVPQLGVALGHKSLGALETRRGSGE
jgi:hypothetical protein